MCSRDRITVRALLLVAVVSVLDTAAAVHFPVASPVRCGSCSEHEVLHITPPCCEATCEYDCHQMVCRKMLVYEPTCVCVEGFVRHDGQCIPKTQCPKPKPTVSPTPCETTTVTVTPETTEQTTTVPYTSTTSTTTTSSPITSTTTATTSTSTTARPPCSTSAPPRCACNPCRRHRPSCGCNPPPAKYSTTYTNVPPPPLPTYQTIPPYRYSSTVPSTDTSPTSTAPTTTVLPTTTTMAPPEITTTATTPAPTSPAPCAACEQLVYVLPCCEPSCDNDCSEANCQQPLLLVQEATCACQPGLVRYQGHCIEPSACPRGVSRYCLLVPVAAQCQRCNGKPPSAV